MTTDQPHLLVSLRSALHLSVNGEGEARCMSAERG